MLAVASDSEHSGRNALRTQPSKEYIENYNREEGFCEGEKGFVEAQPKEELVAHSPSLKTREDGEATCVVCVNRGRV